MTTLFQDAAQAQFGSLNGSGLSLRQFDPNAPTANSQNYYLSPTTGQPGSDADLYYTFNVPLALAAPSQLQATPQAFGGLDPSTKYITWSPR